jgi:tRNA pseudouridine synthase 10
MKLTRELGQSPWLIEGERLCPSSVEEEIQNGIIKIIDCDSCSLHAGGREDRDVRMLGDGRPFIIEIFNPKNRISPLKNLKLIEDSINNGSEFVKVKSFDVCDRLYINEIKKYENAKKKIYACVVWASQPISTSDIEKINKVKDLEVIQKTPLRVLHRRTLMDRKKTIYSLEAKKVNDNFMIVNVLASAGTYIKEFIHSDLGRTVPNIGTIVGYECDIIQLDVLNIIYS